MVKFLSLSLKGFGCFGQGSTFSFSGSLDTLSALNEAGKSTMLNGVLHTLFGMRKQDKERFRSWSHPSPFKGRLVLKCDEVLYRIDMDFERDRVMVAKSIEKGPYEAFLSDQQHVPAGTKSEAYLSFLQEVFGTPDIEVFKSAFVVEQPLKDKMELGQGKDLILSNAGGLYNGALKRLLDRLGKDEKGITKHIDEYDALSSAQRKNRLLEDRKAELDRLKGELQESETTLDSIFPLTEKLNEANERITNLKEKKRAIGSSVQRYAAWVKMRGEYEEAGRRARSSKEILNKLRQSAKEKEAAEEKASELMAGAKGEPLEGSALETIIEASSSLKKLLSESAAILDRCSSGRGISNSLIGLNLLDAGAETRLSAMASDASAESTGLASSAAALEQWQRQFGPVAAASEQDVETWRKQLEALRTKEKAKLSKGIFPSRMAFISAFFAAIAALVAWPTARQSIAYQLIFIFIAAFSAALAAIAKRPAGKGSLKPVNEEEAAIVGKIELYRMMGANPAPSLPEGYELKIESLRALSEDCRTLARLSSGAQLIAGSIRPTDFEAAVRMAGAEIEWDAKALSTIDDSLWERAKAENASRSSMITAISEAQDKAEKIESLIQIMIKSADASSMAEVAASAELAEREASSVYAKWEGEFAGDAMLKPDLSLKKLGEIQDEQRRLRREESLIEPEMESAQQDADDLRTELSRLKVRDIDNVPYLRERIEEVETEIAALKEEAEALGIAISQIRVAAESFSGAAAETLGTKITELLSRVTGNDCRLMKVGRDFDIVVEHDGRALTEDQLSQGTKDQLYISMRIAAAELLGQSRGVPMFFDDSFGTTDERRLGEIRDLLTELARSRQFMVLSHSDAITNWGKGITQGKSDI